MGMGADSFVVGCSPLIFSKKPIDIGDSLRSLLDSIPVYKTGRFINLYAVP